MAVKKATPKSKKSTKKSSNQAAKSSTKITTISASETEKSTAPKAEQTKSPILNIDKIANLPLTSRALAEFIGAFLLASIVLIVRNEPFYLFIALMGIFAIFGNISGAHVNPAITIASWATKRIGWVQAVFYIFAQSLAAMLAVVVMNQFIHQAPEVTKEALDLGQTAPKIFAAIALPEGKEVAVLVAEILGAAILGFAYAGVLKKKLTENTGFGALNVGVGAFLALAIASTATGFVSATSILNPALAISLDAINSKNLFWTASVYIVAPILGAIVGFFLNDLIRKGSESEI